MNILTLSSLYPRPYDPVDGIFVHQHVLHLRKGGCRGLVVCPIPWAPPGQLLPKRKWRLYASVPAKAVFDGIEVYYPRYFRPPGRWFRPLAGLAIFLSLGHLAHYLGDAAKIDLIHAHTILPDGSAALRLAKKLNIPCICTAHGSDLHTHPFENARTLAATRQVLQTADRITTISKDLKRIAGQLGQTRSEICVIYPGIDADYFQAGGEPAAGRRQLQLEAEGPLILFIGHLIRSKGVFDLIEALAEVVKNHSATLGLVGAGAEEQQVVALIERLNLSERVILAGRKNYAEISQWLGAADMLVLPSHGEGLGNVVLEAMACSRAVIASAIGGIPELVIDGLTGLLVPPQTPSKLAGAIQSLLNDPARCREMGRQGRARVKQEFSWENHVAQMLALYGQTVRL